MRICLICTEIFAWGKYGGFGRSTRTIGRELAKRGIEVFAVIPRRQKQREVENLDSINVFGYPKFFPFKSIPILKKIDADIYHSEEPSFVTYLALKTMPDKKNIITLRDTRDIDDWKIELKQPSLNKLQVLSNIIFEDNHLVYRAVRQADAVFCAAHFLAPKALEKYHLKEPPLFLPTPVFVKEKIFKSRKPTVCFVGRWDRRKRPEIFFNLAKSFPKVRFIAVGRSRNKKYDALLRRSYASLDNLEMTGFIDQFSTEMLADIFEKSWIMVNTASREGLPNTFIEAASYRCAILSSVNPDGFASKFGYHVTDDDFSKGLRYLLDEQRWAEYGERGYQYVKDTFETSVAIDKHIKIYKDLIEK